ncbi:MAG: nucleotidyltransferase, partial [Ignavibacteria bacterium]|nr:nucleotidyltransferase [Ignavibacteria bacterium]
MKIAGIITEYNPLHNGHIYHIQKTKELTYCDLLICVMSGHFVQRGEPTIIDKWTRTESALNSGIDLVIELPYPFVVQSAKHFANASVRILELIGCTDIVFGSESNDIESLTLMAELPINVDGLKENLNMGMGYPKAYGLVQGSFHPNDILGIAYLKAISKTQIKAHCIQRTNHYHDEDLNHSIASATAIRKALKEGKDVSTYTPMYLELSKQKNIYWEDYYDYIKTKLLTLNKEELQTIFLMDEGLENHFKKQIKHSDTFESFMNNCIGRRYTRARIQRACVHLLTHTKRTDIPKLELLNNIRVLGFNTKGQGYLKSLHDKDIKVASRFNQMPENLREL